MSHYLTTTRVAEMIGCSRSTLESYLLAKKFPPPDMRVTSAGWRRWKIQTVKAWIKLQADPSTRTFIPRSTRKPSRTA